MSFHSGSVAGKPGAGKSLFAILFASACLLAPVSVRAQTNFRISGPITTPLTVEGDVGDPRISPDGQRVVYLADQDTDGVVELYSALLDRSEGPVKLSEPEVDRQVVRYEISPDGRHVVYLQSEQGFEYELYGVPIDGSSSPVELGPSGSRSIQFTPDGETVVFAVDERVLYRASVDGSSPLVELFRLAPGAGTLVDDPPYQPGFQLSFDGSRAVFLVRREGWNDLYSVSLDAGRSSPRSAHFPRAVRLNTGRSWIPAFRICGDSVVYRTDELHSVPIDGSERPRRISGPMVPGGSVVSFVASADGRAVVFLADGEIDEVYELRSVAADGSSEPITLVPGGEVEYYSKFEISPDSRRVLYVADRVIDVGEVQAIHGVPLDGSASGVALAALPRGEHLETLRISPDGRWFVYLTDGCELFGAPIDGRSPPIKINGERAGNCDLYDDHFEFVISPDSRRVLYHTDEETRAKNELYSTPIYGGASADTHGLRVPPEVRVKLSSGGEVGPFAISPDGERVAYVADEDTPSVHELYEVPIDRRSGSSKLNPPLAIGTIVPGDVASFAFGPDGALALYLADQEADEQYELYGVGLRPGARPVKLNAPLVAGGDVAAFEASPDGSAVVYAADQEQDGRHELFRVPSDGRSPPMKLSGPLEGGSVITDSGHDAFRISPDGARVVYYADRNGVIELFSVPIDGSSAAVRLNDSLPDGGDVSAGARISPDGALVVYRADQDRDDVFELYSVPIDGSSPPEQLNGSLEPGGKVAPESIFLDPLGRRVVYLADENTLGSFELFSVPIDGSANPITLNGPLAPGPEGHVGGISDVAISPDGLHVVYQAAQERAMVFELYGVPIDGSGGPTKLSGPMITGGDIRRYRISADGSRVVYLADQMVNERVDLYSAPIDGSLPPVRLNAAATSERGVRSFALGTGSRVVFAVDQDPHLARALYSAPIDGGSPAVELDAATPEFVYDFRIEPGGAHVVYEAGQNSWSGGDLYRVAIDGGSAPVRLSGLPSSGQVRTFQVSPDARSVVYLADQDTDEVFELHAARFLPFPVRSGPAR